MSNPNNILDQAESYTCHCVIAAFADTPEAESTEIPLLRSLDMGDKVPNSNGIIVINDHRPSATQVIQYNIEYIWNSVEANSTMTAGEILVADRNATGFLKFLKENIVDNLGVSLENITFVLKTFWIASVSGEGNNSDLIDSKKFYFSIADVRQKTDDLHNVYMLSILSLHDTKMQLPNNSNLYNMTLTHKEGNLHKEIPTPKVTGGGIRPRGVEDGQKNDQRKERIDKSKPMITLDEVFKSLETELNESVNIHDMQLQRWQETIREGFREKLKSPAIQNKELPIDYNIILDEHYSDYEIDNRNMPFEQPEQAQNIKGIRVIPCKAGESFYKFIDTIFSMSKKAGIDARDGYRPKVVAVWRKIENRLKVDINIKRVRNPSNGAGEDTGPGEGGIEPITFFYRTNSGDIQLQNTDVYNIISRTSRERLIEVTEDSPLTEDGRVSFGGERENITVERNPTSQFFNTGYSGHRAFLANHKVMGVEYPNELASYISAGLPNQYTQKSDMTIKIRGNPELFSDFLREPSKVASGSAGEPKYYAKPEVNPVYVKFRIYYTNPNENDGIFERENVDGEFYHRDVYMHVQKIAHCMTNGVFYQKLHLLRTDTLI